jgi:alkylmercury lyase
VPQTPKPPIPELAETLAEAMPSLEPDQQQLALAVYRQLARGEPVRVGDLASELGLHKADVAAMLEPWPGVFRGEDGRIVSFWGLAIPEMPHRFRVDGCRLHTWCAWDALFIPELIGRTAEVESRPPLGGGSVRLTVDPDRVRAVDPAAAVVAMLSPAEAFDYRVVMTFCHFVHFFPSPQTGSEWVAEHPGTFLLSVPEAHELGRIVNRRRFGTNLEPMGADRASR